jgi:hypothetical protein
MPVMVMRSSSAPRRGAGKHDEDRSEAAQRFPAVSAGQHAVGGETGEGQGQHGGGEVADGEAPDRGVLQPEADSQQRGRDQGRSSW